MPVFFHDDIPVHAVPRIKTRVIADRQHGAEATSVWEQWIDADGYIPLHYHDVEEILVILAGEISLTLGDQTSVVRSPATVVVPAHQLHSLRPSGREQVHMLAFFPDATPKIFAPDGTLRPMPWDDVAVG
jgi:mannose-6-phosphate isomerase-like protein (cupin superfamily)